MSNPCLHRPLSFSKHTHSHFISVSTSYFSCLDSWWCWVTVHDVILPPQDLSDVAATNANRDSREWHPKTKFIADIPKGKGETNLAGKGHMLYHKMLIADILKKNDKIKFIAEGHDQYHKTKEVGVFMPTFMGDTEHPCDAYATSFGDCMSSEESDDVEGCVDCFNEAFVDFEDRTNLCTDMEEEDFCSDLVNCAVGPCMNDCLEEIVAMANGIIYYDGCTNYEFRDECFSGI